MDSKQRDSALYASLLENGGQIFRGNTTPTEEIIDEKAHPENYEHLTVRIGGCLQDSHG